MRSEIWHGERFRVVFLRDQWPVCELPSSHRVQIPDMVLRLCARRTQKSHTDETGFKKGVQGQAQESHPRPLDSECPPRDRTPTPHRSCALLKLMF
mmetsp:Transcript_62748/g.166527  ORF Transcript_62748/g.166527 Transcript_62748/m.166527 type:complete len:96 (+) Transcript_62748:3-290(+)